MPADFLEQETLLTLLLCTQLGSGGLASTKEATHINTLTHAAIKTQLWEAGTPLRLVQENLLEVVPQ